MSPAASGILVSHHPSPHLSISKPEERAARHLGKMHLALTHGFSVRTRARAHAHTHTHTHTHKLQTSHAPLLLTFMHAHTVSDTFTPYNPLTFFLLLTTPPHTDTHTHSGRCLCLPKLGFSIAPLLSGPAKVGVFLE